MSFDSFGLDSRIEAGVRSAGYTEPTPIQKQAIPVVLEGRDVLGIAQTGTGKTAAFLLPILQHLTTGPLRQVRALIVAPTRELADQIHESALVLARKLKVRSITLYGGVGKMPQVEKLRHGVEIVVACPGRLLDHVGDRSIDLSTVEVLVLDEADRMCDMGFLPDIRRILRELPSQRQTLFFSATMPQEIRQLSRSILRDPTTVQIGIAAPAETVAHALYPVPDSAKTEFLLAMLEETATGRVLIFTRTKHRAKRLAKVLTREGYRVAALQGNMTQNARQNAIRGFRSGKFDLLVATDIAARGIDVSEISHVINFDMPDTVDAYTHRIGRTGRAERTGDAFTIAVADDAVTIRQVERVLGAPIERRRLEGFDYRGFVPERLFSANGPRSNATRNRNDRRPASSGRGPKRGRGDRQHASTGGGPKRGPGDRRPDSTGGGPKRGPGDRRPASTGGGPKRGPGHGHGQSSDKSSSSSSSGGPSRRRRRPRRGRASADGRGGGGGGGGGGTR